MCHRRGQEPDVFWFNGSGVKRVDEVKGKGPYFTRVARDSSN